MNSNSSRQIRTATFATVVAFVACASTASPSFAAHAHRAGDGCGGTSSVSPYAEPIAALDGMTLAEYILQHQADDPRTSTVG